MAALNTLPKTLMERAQAIHAATPIAVATDLSKAAQLIHDRIISVSPTQKEPDLEHALALITNLMAGA